MKRFFWGIVLAGILVFGVSSDVLAKEYTVGSVNLQFTLDDNWVEHEGEKKRTFSEHDVNHILFIDVVPSPGGEKFQEFSQLGDDAAMQDYANHFVEAKKLHPGVKVLNYKVVPFAKTHGIYTESSLDNGDSKGYARSITTVHDGKMINVMFLTFTEGNFDRFKGSAMKVFNSMTFTDLKGENIKIESGIKTEQNTNTKGQDTTKEKKTSDEDSRRIEALISGFLWAIIKFGGIMLLFYGARKLYKSFRKTDNNDDKTSSTSLKNEYEKQIESDLITLNSKIEEAIKKLLSQLRMPYVFQNFSDKDKAVILSDATIFIHFLCIKKIIDKQDSLEYRRLKSAHDMILINMLNFLKENGLLLSNDVNADYEIMMEEYVKDDDKKICELLNAENAEVLCGKLIVMLMDHLRKIDLLADMDFREVLIDWYSSEVVPILKFYDESILLKVTEYTK